MERKNKTITTCAHEVNTVIVGFTQNLRFGLLLGRVSVLFKANFKDDLVRIYQIRRRVALSRIR